MVTKASLSSAPVVAAPAPDRALPPIRKSRGTTASAPPLRSAHQALKGLAKVEAELAAPLEGVDFYRTAAIIWERPLKKTWEHLDAPTRARLKQSWIDRLVRPAQSNEVKWERLWMRTFFKQEYQALIERSITEVPSDPRAPLPEPLKQASTRFLREVAHALYGAVLTRRTRTTEGREGREKADDPLIAKLICLNTELVRRAQWGDPVELRELQPTLATGLDGASAGALQRAQLARAAAQALAGMLKRAEVAPHGDQGEVLVVELRDGSRHSVRDLYSRSIGDSDGANWVRQQEQQLSLALVLLQNPGHAALRKLWSEQHRWSHHGLEGTFLTPALTAPAPQGEAGRRAERAIQDLAQAITRGADPSAFAGRSTRLVQGDVLPPGRRARAILQLFGAVEANPSAPGAAEALRQMIALGRDLPGSAQFYAGTLATRALVVVGRAQAIDPATLEEIAFGVLKMTSNPESQAGRRNTLQQSGLLDAVQLDGLATRLRESEQAHLAQAVQERRPNVERFLGDLRKQRAAIAKGLAPAIEGGLPGAIEAAFAIKQGGKTDKFKARIDRVLPELEAAWGRAPCAAHTLYGAALLDAIKDAYPSESLLTFLKEAEATVWRSASEGHHGGAQRYLAAFLAAAPLFAEGQTFTGPAYRLEDIEGAVARLKVMPADPWAALAHLHGLLALLPGRAAEFGAPLQQTVRLLLGGKEREAKAQLSSLLPKVEAAFVRPPVLEERIALVDHLFDAQIFLLDHGVRSMVPALNTFRDTPTAENLVTAQREWAPIKAQALAKAATRPDRERAAIEIGVNLIDAVLAPAVDTPWIEALNMLVDKAREAKRAHRPDEPHPLPERPLEWLQGLLARASTRDLESMRYDELQAVNEVLLKSAQAEPNEAEATLALATQTLQRWAQVVRADDPLWAAVIARVSQDSTAARSAGASDLALHLFVGALADHSYTGSAVTPSEVSQRAASEFGRRANALSGHQPRPGVGDREFAAEVLGSLRVLSECIPQTNPLRPMLDHHLDAAWRSLTSGEVDAAKAEIQQACRIGGSMSFMPASRRAFEPAAHQAPVERVRIADLQPGDLVRLPARNPNEAEQVASFGGRQAGRSCFTSPAGETWSTADLRPDQRVERFSSPAALWEAVALQPGALGSWSYFVGPFPYRGEQRYGRLERAESGGFALVTADGETHPLDLKEIVNLQVGLSKASCFERFFAEHLGEGVQVAHEGTLTGGVLLGYDDAKIELRGFDGELRVIERQGLLGVQSADR